MGRTEGENRILCKRQHKCKYSWERHLECTPAILTLCTEALHVYLPKAGSLSVAAVTGRLKVCEPQQLILHSVEH